MIRPIKENGVSQTAALFVVGQLVHHKRYDYRGVIVDLDCSCRAPDSWYHKNNTQPTRDQPWYHILVHESMAATYAAQENLEPDTVLLPICHPLVEVYFKSFIDGRYLRSDEPWQGWED